MKEFQNKYPFLKLVLRQALVLSLLLIFIQSSYSVIRVSARSGDWNSDATWGCFRCVPRVADDVVISAGHTVSLTSGAITIGNLTIEASGELFQTVKLTVRGSLTINGLHSGSGNLSLSGNNSIIDGTGTIDNSGIFFIDHNSSIAATADLEKNYGNVQINSNRIVTNNGIFRILNGNLIGGNASSTWINEVNSLLEIGGDLLVTGVLTATAIGNKVVFSGGVFQQIKNTDYFDVEVNKISTTTAAFIDITTILNNLTVISGITESGPFPLTVNGLTEINGRLNITSSIGSKIFNGITIGPSGILECIAAVPVNINGNIENNGTFISNSGIFSLDGTLMSISGANQVQFINLQVNGSYTNNGIVSIINSISGPGSFSQGINSTLDLQVPPANITIASLNADAVGNTTIYSSTIDQEIGNPIGGYYNLTIAGSGIKSPVSNLLINGNLNISSTLDASLSNFNINLNGNWNNTGTFIHRNASVIFTGGNQNINNPAGETFYNLTLSGTGIKTIDSEITVVNDIEINSTLDVSTAINEINIQRNWINNGTFIPRTGTVFFNGPIAQSIGGIALTTFRNINVNNASRVSLSADSRITGTLTVDQGVLNTAGFNFTLVSNANGTARIAALTTGDVTGDVIMERYLGSGPNDWRFLSSAVGGRTLEDWKDDFIMSGFSGSHYPTYGFISIYTYNESTPGLFENGYEGATSITNPITTGKGYWAYIGPTPLTIDVKGPIHKGLVSLPVTYTPSSAGASQDGWCMVGNPYPSSINWDAAGWVKTNVSNAVYIWNSSNQQYSVYQGGLGINGGSRFIASSQAFWVQTYGPSPALSLTENVKAANGNFLKSNSNPNMLKFTISGNGFKDETILNFDANSSISFEPNIDAKKLYSFNANVPSITTVADSVDLSLNYLPDLTGDISIPIKVLAGATGNYTLNIDKSAFTGKFTCIILEDLLLGTLIDLNNTASYSFELNDSTSAPRFLLHLKPALEKQIKLISCSNLTDGSITATGKPGDVFDFTWNDILGNNIKTTTGTNSDSITNLPPGIYVLTVSGTTCGAFTDTIEIESPVPLSSVDSYTNASCPSTNDGTATTLVTGGTTPYSYFWNNGLTQSSISGLAAGLYEYQVTDSKGCIYNGSINISSETEIIASFNTSADTVILNPSNWIDFYNTSYNAQTYLWEFGDGTTSSLENSSHQYSSAGKYQVKLSAYNNSCEESVSSEIVVIDSSTDLIDYSPVEELIFFQDNNEIKVIFNLDTQSEATISVFNIPGQKVLAGNKLSVKKDIIPVDLSTLNPGVYIISVNTEKNFISKKVVKL